MATQKRYPMKSSGPLDNMEMTTEDEEKKEPKSDRWNLAILLLLYMLQGIPLGLAGSMPMVLQAKRIGYRQQAVFSFVSWPFSVKLLWAPIVDSLYNSQFGRRKSWLVPAQYVIGITMIVLSYSINDLIGADGVSPNILMLTLSFLILYMCAATQDIAVDGWAISMLSRENVGHASTCNSVGQTAGYFIGYTIFLALESKEFCNTYLRSVPQDYGLIDIQGFMFYFGFIFIIVTSCIMLFKKEKNDANINPEIKNDIYSAYQQLLMLFKLRPVQVYAVFLLTAKIAFAAADNITGLKLIEAGLPRENIALIALPIAPIQILLPLVISRYIAGPRPMDLYFKAVPFRMLMSLMFGVMVWWTNQIPTAAKGEFPVYYYVILVTSFLVHQVFAYAMFVSTMSFHAQISDPLIGGTYMTLLNTLANLGGTWVGTLALWLVDVISFKDCVGVTDASLDCDTMAELQACQAAGGNCVTHIDGYYIQMVVCLCLGVIWYVWQRKRITKLQNLDRTSWHVTNTDTINH